MKHVIWIILTISAGTVFGARPQEPDEIRNYNPRFEVFRLPGDELVNSVQAITQDSAGFLWFATQGGLLRYDGRNFVVYRHDPDNPNTPASDYMEAVFIDSKGLLWMPHWRPGGATSFDPESGVFTRYESGADDPQSLLPGAMSVVTEDNEGYIWLGGEQGLNRIDRKTGKVKRFVNDPKDPRSLSSDQVRALTVDKGGVLWIGTGSAWNPGDNEHQVGGLNRYDAAAESFTRFMHDRDDPTSISSNVVRVILEDSRGNFWIGTAGSGLQKLDRQTGKFERFTYDPANPGKLARPYLRGTLPDKVAQSSHVTSMMEDRQGRIWITAIEGGLNVYDPGSGIMRHFEKGTGPGEMGTNFLWHLHQSRNGTVWISTGGDGKVVYKVTDRRELIPFNPVMRPADESGANYHSIVPDRFGNLWLGQENPGRLRRVNRQTGTVDIIELDREPDSLNLISVISVDRDGRFWISTNRGLYTGDPATARFEPFTFPGMPAEVLSNFRGPVVQTGDGIFWLTSFDKGLYQINTKTGKFINYRNDPKDPGSLAGNRTWAVYPDSKGDLWVGGGSPWLEPGMPLFIDRFNSKSQTFEHFIKGEKLPGLGFAITGDEAGNIWFIDFVDGFFKLNPLTRELKKFTAAKNGLPAGQIEAMVKAPDGKIWLSFEKGLVEFDPVTENMFVLNPEQGIRPAVWHWGAATAATDGELLFARKDGYHAFYPGQVARESQKKMADLRITGFRMLDGRLSSGSSAGNPGIFTKPIWRTESISLNHDQNVFSFSVACFDFDQPEPGEFEFMLEGYDRFWRKDIRDGETPSYINIPPGEYTFRLRVVSNYGTRDREGIRLGILIHPPWWKTWWAYTFYGLMLVLCIFGVDRVQRRRILARERAQSAKTELAQAREIEKAYRELKATQSQLVHAEKMASLGELTAGIAHEIQNPLNFVNNFSEVSAEMVDELDEMIDEGNAAEMKAITMDLKDNLLKIFQHGQRASSIVKGMLEHSRSGSGRKELTDINTMADEYLRLSYHGLRAKNKSFTAQFTTDLDGSLPKVHAVGQEIGRVLLNLINNAFYAVYERHKEDNEGYTPVVTVKTTRFEHHIEVRVGDNGNGIPAALKEKIFQPFFTTKPAGEGTGLGLSLSYDIIVKGHGGQLAVETEPGIGTTFIITLPLGK